MEIMDGKLNPEEVKDLNEFMEYLTTDGGAWALGTSHLETIGENSFDVANYHGSGSYLLYAINV